MRSWWYVSISNGKLFNILKPTEHAYIAAEPDVEELSASLYLSGHSPMLFPAWCVRAGVRLLEQRFASPDGFVFHGSKTGDHVNISRDGSPHFCFSSSGRSTRVLAPRSKRFSILISPGAVSTRGSNFRNPSLSFSCRLRSTGRNGFLDWACGDVGYCICGDFFLEILSKFHELDI